MRYMLFILQYNDVGLYEKYLSGLWHTIMYYELRHPHMWGRVCVCERGMAECVNVFINDFPPFGGPQGWLSGGERTQCQENNLIQFGKFPLLDPGLVFLRQEHREPAVFSPLPTNRKGEGITHKNLTQVSPAALKAANRTVCL